MLLANTLPEGFTEGTSSKGIAPDGMAAGTVTAEDTAANGIDARTLPDVQWSEGRVAYDD
jgi:hypothetical protein